MSKLTPHGQSDQYTLYDNNINMVGVTRGVCIRILLLNIRVFIDIFVILNLGIDIFVVDFTEEEQYCFPPKNKKQKNLL